MNMPRSLADPPPEPPGTPELQPDLEPPERLVVDLVVDAGDWPPLGELEVWIGDVARIAADRPELAVQVPASVCLAFIDDAAIRTLNRQFRGKDQPTNVLSFPSGLPRQKGRPQPLGDIALACETVMREAFEQGIAPADHIRHLFLHGLLHLMGFDHETEAEAMAMERLETEVLGQLGIADPYGEAACAP